MLVAVRQGQRREAAATGEERLGRYAAGQSEYIRLYRYSGKLALAAMNLRRVRVDGRVRRMFVPLAPEAQSHCVGLRWHCRGQACGGMLGAMERLTPVRHATPRTTTKYLLVLFPKY